jgi:signal transduction histidine kinase
VLAASFAVWFVWRLASNMQKEYEAVLNSAQALAQSRLDDVKPAPCGIYETMDKALLDVKDNYVKEVQNALTSQSAQTELVSNVSHDLKTPMTGILTYADLLETADNLDQAKQYAAKISAYTKRLASLTDDLFDVSKAQAGALPLDAASLDLAALIEETAADYQKALDENKLELVLKLHCANVHLDPDKTMRIFDNLLSNAVKYSLEGSRIFVEMTDTDDAVSVVVRNISKQPLDLTEEEVVRRFVRGDASRTDAGAGIGLAIAQSFAKAQEGSLDIRILNDVFEAVVTLPKEKKQA